MEKKFLMMQKINYTKLYVSFALKKAERKEELIKMKEKLFKESQKMTIYAKIQEDEMIKTEEDFKNRIMDYLKRLMGGEYKPKLIKVRIEQKNAFITMNSKEDAKTFIKKFKELIGEKNDIYFNTYKSKLERVNAQMKFKNYNNFSETGSLVPSSSSSIKGGRTFKDYNNFNMPSMGQNQPPQFPPRNQGRPQFKDYNDFSNMGNMGNMNNQFNQPKNNMVNYNNPGNNNLNNDVIFDNVYNELRRKMDQIEGIKEKEQAGDFIYELAEGLYKEEAGKITGMILEYDLDKIINMIMKEPKKLKEQIISCHNLIQTNK